MARKRTKATREAQALLVWLESLELPTRVINALRRDLEVVTGEREDEDGGVLAGFDQARFTEELYQKRGGQVAKVPSVAASAIEALRAAIPAPMSGDISENPQEAQGDEEVADAIAETTEAPQEGAASEVGDAATAAPDSQEEAPAAAAPEAVEAAEPPVDAAPAAVAGQVEASPTPNRRGRPPRAVADATAAVVPVDVTPVPTRRPGRPRRDEVASEAPAELPPRTRRARVAAARDAAQQAPAPEAPPPPPAEPAAPTAADPSFDVLLRLWRELHPHGQRAAMHFMADLLVG
jgi:hypothetical protein